MLRIKVMCASCETVFMQKLQNIFRWWVSISLGRFIGARQPAFDWTNADLDLCRHIASLGHKTVDVCINNRTMYITMGSEASFSVNSVAHTHKIAP